MITIFYLPDKMSLESVKQIGFDGVSLWWSNEFGDENYRDNPALVRAAGLFVESLHMPFESVNNLWLDDHSGDSLADNFIKLVDECADYGIPTMVIHPSSSNNPPPFNEFGLDRVKRIVERAERRSVNIAFENVRVMRHLDYVLSNISSPRVGFCYDSGHHACYYPHEDILVKHGSRLMSLHLHDNDGVSDQHLLPFDGVIDWVEVMRGIAKTGYTGAIALEVLDRGYEGLAQNEFLQIAFERGKSLNNLKR